MFFCSLGVHAFRYRVRCASHRSRIRVYCRGFSSCCGFLHSHAGWHRSIPGSFFDRSEGSLPLGHLWNFGDGTTSREQNPTHIYATNGKYTVTLTVTNSFGQDTKTLTGFIAVGDPPVPDFSASPSQGNIPLDVAFTGLTNDTMSSWRWDFGDGSFADGQNPTHTYTKPGIYSVTLSAANEFGTGHITKSGIINTGVVPDAEFIAEIRQGYPPLTVRFRDFSSGSPLAWSWDFGDGTTSTKKIRCTPIQKRGGIPPPCRLQMLLATIHSPVPTISVSGTRYRH